MLGSSDILCADILIENILYGYISGSSDILCAAAVFLDWVGEMGSGANTCQLVNIHKSISPLLLLFLSALLFLNPTKVMLLRT